MKKFFCGLLALLLLVGCTARPAESTSVASPSSSEEGSSAAKPSSAEEAFSTSEEGYTFSDALGRTVTVESCRRAAAMIGSFADIWCLAGGKDSLVAAAHDSWTSFDLNLDDSVTDIGSSKDPSLEALLAAEPDFVIASASTGADVDLLETFEAAGITVAYFEVATVAQYAEMLKVCTEITGCKERYAEFGEGVLARCRAAAERADGSRPTALYVRITGDKYTVKNNEGSVLGEMLKDLDCENIADSDASLLEELSLEAVLQADPDHIFVVFQGGQSEAADATADRIFFSNPAWETLTAVREGRYHVMDEALYNLKPNARWGEAYEGLADLLYPAE